MQKLSNAARDLKISKITKEDYERMSKDMEELQEALNRSQTFISTITKAVDPNKLLVSLSPTAVALPCALLTFH